MNRAIRAMGGLAIALALSVSADAQVVAPSYKDTSGLLQPSQGVVSLGGSNTAAGQASVGTSATLVVAARARQKVTFTVTSAVACSFGGAGVTASTGFPLQAVAGATITLDTSAAIYAVCASTATIGYIELF